MKVFKIKNYIYDILNLKLIEKTTPTLTQLILSTLRGERFNLFVILGAFMVIAMLNLCPVIILSYMIKQGVMRADTSVILPLMFILFIFSLSLGLFSQLKLVLCARFEKRVTINIQSILMQRLLRMPVQFFDDYTIGDLGHRILIVDSLTKLLGPNQMGAFLSFIFSVISFSVMMYCSWQLTLCTLFLASVVLFLSTWGLLRILPHVEEHSESMGQAHGFMFNAINGISRIKLFTKESVVHKRWSDTYNHARDSLFSAYNIGIWRFTLFGVLQSLFVFLLFGTVTWLSNILSVKFFMVYFLAFMQFIVMFIAFLMNANSIVTIKSVCKRLKPILNSKPEPSTSQQLTETCNLFEVSIYFKALYFKYPTSTLPILKGINCSIEPGQHTAFVGLSGSGKSTILKLLLGFYLPDKGGIYFGDQPLHQLDFLALRRGVGIVFQDSKLIAGTIFENIIGHTDVTEERAWYVAKLIGLDKFIQNLPMGMQTTVSQHMNLISGGQKQLILIARALVHEPRLLLLDEATNSLDNLSQERVVQGINDLKITRVSIAHRLSSIKHADKIMVLEQGQIVESGTYSELIGKKKAFYKLAENQLNVLSSFS